MPLPHRADLEQAVFHTVVINSPIVIINMLPGNLRYPPPLKQAPDPFLYLSLVLKHHIPSQRYNHNLVLGPQTYKGTFNILPKHPMLFLVIPASPTPLHSYTLTPYNLIPQGSATRGCNSGGHSPRREGPLPAVEPWCRAILGSEDHQLSQHGSRLDGHTKDRRRQVRATLKQIIKLIVILYFNLGKQFKK